ncbi:hypothetical protein ATCC90586_003251 [Pythium insidiosum]|nr:hypothetical protein ATCC90586_003251 [Pythium insidiosum]
MDNAVAPEALHAAPALKPEPAAAALDPAGDAAVAPRAELWDQPQHSHDGSRPSEPSQSSRALTQKERERLLRESRATGERSIEMALAEAQLIKENVYVQRKKRRLEEEEIPVCSCTPPLEYGVMGCVENCLNRVALIECLPGHCPCGDRCDNQRIQRGRMPATKLIDCGRKGLGLKTLESIRAGDFVAEYTGEIVTEQEYHLRRLRYHNEKHRYMMVLSGGEVIDATRMGGLARFINHSCEPNCGVEKWDVDGEERCGIFALRDIMPGEELSFDYKFESFSRLEITQCLCGSPNCRGLIGANNRVTKKPSRSAFKSKPDMYNSGKRKPFDPILASASKGTTSRRTADSTLDRIQRVLSGQRVLTKKEAAFVLQRRVLLRRNLTRHVQSNLRLLCLEPHFLLTDGRLGDVPPTISLRELPTYPARLELADRDARAARLETEAARLRTRMDS